MKKVVCQLSQNGLRLLLIMAATLRMAATTYATPALPMINTNNVVNIMDYGALGDGVTTNTAAIQNAINAAAAGGTTNGVNGGTVEIPAGIFLCGPITLKSSINLQLDSGAILRMLPFGQYPVTWFTNGANVYFTANNFISGTSLTNVEVSGSGWIQGQGEPWWPWADTNNAVRPIMIRLTGCNRTLIQSVTLSNSPMFHIAISGNNGNTTVQGVIIRANPSSDPVNPGHNTDACDVSGTNILVQNCDISVGDDNYTCSGGTSGMVITNNTYGYGHGVSVGSYTSPSVSNMSVFNCTFTNTDLGVRIKSDRDRGGFVHDISYCNLSMTNVRNPILIYTEYTNTTSMYRAVDSISPAIAASYPSAPVTATTPRYRDILISNVTANAQANRTAGLIWGLPEMSISNVTLINVRLTSSKTFGIYNAKNVKIVDSSHSVPSTVSQFSFYNTDVTFSNSAPSANMVTLDGATTNSIANNFTFYNSLASLKNTNALDLNTSVTLGASTFFISNHFTLSPSNSLNFVLGTNAATVAVVGNLSLGGTNNIYAGAGFTNGTYTLMTYTGSLSGNLPILGTTPSNYNYAFDTNTSGQIKLIVTLQNAPPAAPINLVATVTNALIALSWSPSATATSYNIKRSTISGGSYSILSSGGTATNYSDTQVTNGPIYYYVVSGLNANGEGSNSAEVSATLQPPPPMVVTTNVFNDIFSASTLNSTSPASPSATATSYELISSKSWSPAPAISPGHLKFGIGTTTSGIIEAQALFTNSPVALATVGDSLSLIVTFTNTSGLLTQSGALGFGLYNSGQNFPVPGGLNGTATSSLTDHATGNAQTWVGYVGQLAFTGSSSQIITRPAQTSGTLHNNDQDAISSGSSSSYTNNPPVTVGTASSLASVMLAPGNPYTEVLTMTLMASNTLAITNSLYAGTSTNGTLLSQFGGVASGGTYLTNTFDALAIGWRVTANASVTTIDINQISVNSTLTVPTLNPVSLTPPTLASQIAGNQVLLSWPADHLGWRLQIQTNSLSNGLGLNWFTVANSTNVTQTNIIIDPANGSVFLRLVYP
jgi:polygalacturonase